MAKFKSTTWKFHEIRHCCPAMQRIIDIFRSWNPQINLPPYPSLAAKTGFHRECENVSTFNYEMRLSLLSGTQMRSNLGSLVCSINGSRFIILLEKWVFSWKVVALFKKCHVILETECLLCPHPPLLLTCRLIKAKKECYLGDVYFVALTTDPPTVFFSDRILLSTE